MAIRHNPASIPLLSLDAVAFDSETTGLDTSQARMIQLGASSAPCASSTAL
jgi:DNA polymerase III alpha subunit (gram-positive type)